MKILILTLFVLCSCSQMQKRNSQNRVPAEHNKTYCGTIDKSSLDNKHYFAKMNVSYVLDFEDQEEWGEEGIAIIREASSEQKQFISKVKEDTLICVKARWGGGLYSGNLGTDSVYRVDYMSQFNRY